MTCQNRYDFKTINFTELDQSIQLCLVGDKSCPSYTPFENGTVKKVGNYYCHGFCGEKE